MYTYTTLLYTHSRLEMRCITVGSIPPIPTQELEHLPFYPSEILPLFLYLGDHRHAYNAALNYELKIHTHLNMGSELQTAYPSTIAELHIEVEDSPDADLFSHFEEIYKFLGSMHRTL